MGFCILLLTHMSVPCMKVQTFTMSYILLLHSKRTCIDDCKEEIIEAGRPSELEQWTPPHKKLALKYPGSSYTT